MASLLKTPTLRRGLGVMVACLLLWTPVKAQESFRAAAVVNDEIISILDLMMRVRIAILTTGQRDSPELRQRLVPQVMRNLVDEVLQRQEAKSLGIVVSEAQLDEGVADIAQRNGLSSEGLFQALQREGILPEAFVEQVRGQLIWQALISRRLRPTIEVSPEEVEETAQRISATSGANERLLAEIFLSVDSVLEEEDVRKRGQQLMEQLRAGARFEAVARQFSESATAQLGGDLGWVPAGSLDEELEAVLARTSPGSVVGPVRSLSGYHILLLRDQRQSQVGDVSVELFQIFFALPAGAGEAEIADARTKARDARARVTGCAGLEALSQEIGSPGSGFLGELKLADLPAELSNAVATLEIGVPSQPTRVQGGLGVLVVCGRSLGSIDQRQIHERLLLERLDMHARRYMRDLRRNANIDIRI